MATLIIHDGFGGSSGGLSGRTPDTLNTPGNTWAVTSPGNAGVDGSGNWYMTSTPYVSTPHSHINAGTGVINVEIEMSFSGAGTGGSGCGFVARYDGSSTWYRLLAWNATAWTAFEYWNGSSFTSLFSGNLGSSATPMVMKLNLNGTSAIITKNGTASTTYTVDSSSGRTRFGLFTRDSAPRVDYFKVTDLTEAPSTNDAPSGGVKGFLLGGLGSRGFR